MSKRCDKRCWKQMKLKIDKIMNSTASFMSFKCRVFLLILCFEKAIWWVHPSVTKFQCSYKCGVFQSAIQTQRLNILKKNFELDSQRATKLICGAKTNQLVLKVRTQRMLSESNLYVLDSLLQLNFKRKEMKKVPVWFVALILFRKCTIIWNNKDNKDNKSLLSV